MSEDPNERRSFSAPSSMLAAVHRAANQAPGPAPIEAQTTAQEGTTTMAQQYFGAEGLESDDEAANKVAQLNLSRAEANDIWDRRYQRSANIRAEFPTAGSYRGYMNAEVWSCAAKLRREGGARGGGQSLIGLRDAERLAVEDVRARMLSKPERMATWHDRWQRSPALQQEFVSKETYAAFMDSYVDGRGASFHRGRVTG